MAMFFSSLYTQPNQDTHNDTKATRNMENTQSSSYFSLGFSSAFGDVVGRVRKGWKAGGSHDEVSAQRRAYHEAEENPADPALLASKIHDLILNSPLLDASNPLSPLAASGYTPLPPEQEAFGAESSSSPAQRLAPEIGSFQPPQAFNFPVSPPAPNSTPLPHTSHGGATTGPEEDARLLAVLSSPLVMNGDLNLPNSFASFASFAEANQASPMSPGPQLPGSLGESSAALRTGPVASVSSPSARTRNLSVFDVLDSIPSPFASPPPRSPLSFGASLPAELRSTSSPLVSPERDKLTGWGGFGDIGASSAEGAHHYEQDEEPNKEELPDEGSSFMLYSPLVPTPTSVVEVAESGIVEEPGDDTRHPGAAPAAPAQEGTRWFWPFGTSAAAAPAAPTMTRTNAKATTTTTAASSPFATPAPAYSRHPLPTPPRPARRRPRVWVPSKTELSIQAMWWGYRLYLPPPVMGALSSSRSPLQSFSHQATVLTTSLTWFLSNLPLSVLPMQVRPIVALLQLLVPYVGYVGGFVGWSWGRVKGYDEGHGVILTATWLLPVALIPSTWYETDFPPPSPSPYIQHRPLPSIASILAGGDNTQENDRLLGSPPPHYRTEPTTPIYASPPPIHTSIHPLESTAGGAGWGDAQSEQDRERPMNGTAVYLSPTFASSPLAASIYGSPSPFSPTHIPGSPQILYPQASGHAQMFSPPPPSPLLRLSPLPSAGHANLPPPDAGAVNPWTMATPVAANSLVLPASSGSGAQAPTPTSASQRGQDRAGHSAIHPFSPPPHQAYTQNSHLHPQYFLSPVAFSPSQLPMVDPYAYMATPSTVFGNSPSPAHTPSPAIYAHPLSPIQEHPASPGLAYGMPGGITGSPYQHPPSTPTGPGVPGSPVPQTPSSVYGTPMLHPEQQLQTYSPFVGQQQQQLMWGSSSPWGSWTGAQGTAGSTAAHGGDATPPPPPSGRRDVELPGGDGQSQDSRPKAGDRRPRPSPRDSTSKSSSSNWTDEDAGISRKKTAEGSSRTRTWVDPGSTSTDAATPGSSTSTAPKAKKSKSTGKDSKPSKTRRRELDDPSAGMVVVGSTSSSSRALATGRAGPHILTARPTPSRAASQPVDADGTTVKRSKSKLAGSISGITESFGRVLNLEKRRSGSGSSMDRGQS